MTFPESISICIKKYADFHGRAPRSEFWWFYLFQFLVSFGFGIVAGFVGRMLGLSEDVVAGLVVILYLAIMFPGLAVTARRLHDVSRSGWWMLFPVTIVGAIPFYYWLCKAGDPQENQYGTAV